MLVVCVSDASNESQLAMTLALHATIKAERKNFFTFLKFFKILPNFVFCAVVDYHDPTHSKCFRVLCTDLY